MTTRLKCPCGKSHAVINTSSVSEKLAKAPDWGMVPSHDGTWIYLCPECFPKAVEAIETLIGIIRNDYPATNYYPKKKSEDT